MEGHGISRNQNKPWILGNQCGGGWNPGERSGRALFPEGRGLGVGRKKSKSKRVEIQPTYRSGMGLKVKIQQRATEETTPIASR